MKNLKQLLANKNVVTLIGAVVIVLVLYGFYQWKVNQATSQISIPYARVDIPARTLITEDMIAYVKISQVSLKGNILTNSKGQIEGNYSNVGTMIPAGSFFYSGVVVTEKELPDSFLINIDEEMVAYNYRVDITKTYGNSMYPGNYVDVYFKGIEGNKIMVGKLVENVKILSVKDGSGNPVFENSAEDRSPSQIIFAVTDEMHKMLRKAEYITDADLILVPTNVSYVYDGKDGEIATVITSDYIKSYIEERSVALD